MRDIVLDLNNSFISKEEMKDIEPEIMQAQKLLLDKKGISSNMTGWVDYTDSLSLIELAQIKEQANHIKRNCQALIVLGIGGSYLGARAAIEAIRGDFHNELKSPQVYYAGQNLSGAYLKHLIEVIDNKEICVIVISKSGTTLETAVSFRIIKKHIEEKYKDRAKDRIFVVTDKEKGALKSISKLNNYKSFVIPDDIGGRYSVITPVGLLPMAAANLNIDEFIRGLKAGEEQYKIRSFNENICCQYAAARNILNRRGMEVEILVNYEPSMNMISEWWKQLFGESEGKEGKGLYPASLNFTTDLHSMGQFVQEGRKIIFETTIIVEKSNDDMVVLHDENDFDNLNYISGKSLNYINENAFKGTLMAHTEGMVSNIIIKIPEMNEFYLGKLFYFFMMTCGISGYTNKIDPFTQPGVENYKKNMFRLLGKR